MTTTPRLGAPELTEGQAVPEATVNEQVRYAEQGANQFIVKDKDLATPPGSPADGDAYIIAGSPTGAWAGRPNQIAFYLSTAWSFVVPIEGTRAEVQDEDTVYRYSGAAWSIPSSGYSGGVQSTPVLAAAMKPRATNGAAVGSVETTTNKVMVETLDFDASADEFAQFYFPMPKSWNEGTVTAQFIWTATNTGNVVWGIQGLALSDDDALDTAFGTAVTVTDGVTAANDVMQSAFTSAVTIGGTPAEGDFVIFQVYRDADNGSDTCAVDAKLLGIRLNFTTNASDDS
jgi:hypothetical protein